MKTKKMKHTKDYSGSYLSTHDFIATNNVSRKFAEEVLGIGWVAEDDCDQIITLLSCLGELYYNVTSENGSDYIDVATIQKVKHHTITNPAVNKQELEDIEDFDGKREAEWQHDKDRVNDHFERDMNEKFY